VVTHEIAYTTYALAYQEAYSSIGASSYLQTNYQDFIAISWTYLTRGIFVSNNKPNVSHAKSIKVSYRKASNSGAFEVTYADNSFTNADELRTYKSNYITIQKSYLSW
jgi:hypothetical protein